MMKRILFAIVFCSGILHAQCPASQATGINIGLCGQPSDHIQVDPAIVNIQPGQTFQMTNHIVLAGAGGSGGPADCDSGWSSDTPSVATINNLGLVTAVSVGVANISCTPVISNLPNPPVTAQINVLAAPTFATPSQALCAQPCALPNGLGPPSAVAYNYQLTGTGSTHTPYTFSIVTGSLPGWATLTGSTGVISGTPNAIATTPFTAQVCDTLSSCNTMQMSISVVANATSYYPLSTTSTLSQNKVAGQNSNVPSTLWGTAAATTVSVTSNVVTISVANGFTAGSGAGTCTFGGTCGDQVSLSGFTTATWLNGLILGANSSTTSTTLVGPVFNTQGTQVTHANVSSTTETGIYAQGPGLQSFVTAIAPFAGSANCTNGNPCAGQTGALTLADINTWGIDNSIPNTSGGPNKNVWTMWTNPASTSNTVYHPSKSSETYDELISMPDSLLGYFVPFVSSTIFLGHAHYAATGCGGQPCMLLDTPVPSGWYGTNSFGLALSQLPPPSNNQAVGYFVDFSTPFDPKVTKQTYQYQGAGCSGQPCVTLLSSSVLLDIPTACKGWKFTTIGGGPALGKAITVGSSDGLHDTDLNFAIGAGPQNNLGKNMEYHIYNMNTTPACENWDTGGRSGSGMYNDGTTAGLYIVTRGNNYKVGDVISFSIGGVSCIGTTTVNAVTNGSVNLTGGLSLPTMTTNSGCTLGSTLVVSGGSGTGLGLIQSGVGISSSPCCMNIWPSGASSPTVTSLYTYGIHGGTMAKNGGWIANSGYGNTSQKVCSVCDNVFWQTQTTTLKAQTSTLVAGHPAIGLNFRGTSTSPPYTTSPWSDPTCTPSTNCVQIATLPSCPGGTINHSTWPSGSPMSDNGPISITSMQNVPGTPTLTNPENCTTAFGYSIWAVEQNTTTHWFAHSQENSNNYKNEDGNSIYVEMICSPDRVFCIVPTNMKSGFTPANVGLGTDSAGKVYGAEFAVTLN